MLPKKYRLKNKKAFDATYKQRRIVSNSFLTLYAGRNKPDADYPTKIGFVVSKKIHKRAVKRNRIKRLIRESCRLLIKDGSMNNKYLSFIFLPKNTALEADFTSIQSAVFELLRRI